MSEWRKVRCVVEVLVKGDYTEKDLCWDVRHVIGVGTPIVKRSRVRGDRVQFGTFHYKEFGRVQTAIRENDLG